MKIKEAMKSIGKVMSYNSPIIEEYEQILQNKKRRFADGTWQQPNARKYAQIVLRYLFEEKLNLSFDELKNINSYKFKTKWKLNGLFKYAYEGSFQDAILEIYEAWINPWDFHQSVRYLSDDERVETWLMDFAEEYLNFGTNEELLNFFSTPNLRKNHGKVFNYFEGSPYEAYRYFYPGGELRPFEFNMGQNKMWENNEVVKEYLLHLLDEAKISTKEEFVEFISTKAFRRSMKGLYKYFNNSPWKLYQYLKDENIISFNLSIFDLKVLPNGFYQDDENKKQALNWLINEKLNITSKDEYIKKMSMTVVDKYIRGIGPYFSEFAKLQAFIEEHHLIPWEILPWEHRHRPSTIWEDEKMRQKAVRWFFETYLGLIPSEVSVDIFKVSEIWSARLKELYQPYYSQVYTNPKEMWVKTYQNSLK